MAEVIDVLNQLNGRIDTLVLTLLDERNRLAQCERTVPIDMATNPDFTEHVKKAIGRGLLHSTQGLAQNHRGSESFSNCLLDVWQTWAVSCIHLALQPLFFGLYIRDTDEVNRVIHEMTATGSDSSTTVMTCQMLIYFSCFRH